VLCDDLLAGRFFLAQPPRRRHEREDRLAPEIQAHLVATIPNGLTVECMPWSARLFEEVPVMENGELAVPKKPGFGLAFDKATLERYRA